MNIAEQHTLQTPHAQLKAEFQAQDNHDFVSSMIGCQNWVYALGDYLTFELKADVPTKWNYAPPENIESEDTIDLKIIKGVQPTLEECKKLGAIMCRYFAKLHVAEHLLYIEARDSGIQGKHGYYKVS